jgi:hypothetical protein
MKPRLIHGFTALAFTLTAPVALHAQYAPYAPPPGQYPAPPVAGQQYAPTDQLGPVQQQGAPIYDEAQLEQLLAPVALYPDQLLGQVLMASTYPAEVEQAGRWLQDPRNVSLRGDALAAALAQQDWDPSVKSLVAFPSVLQMMNSQPEWTQRLGDAFLAQQGQMMDSVQRLRREALDSGRLQSTPQQVVTTQGSDIVIQPANPNVVYVPSYDPSVVYGSWAYPDYPPYYFGAPGGYAYGPLGIDFGVGYGVVGPYWGWDDFDWRRHRVHIDRDRFGEMDRFHRGTIAGDTWEHNPEHRRGVTYRDTASQQRYTRTTIGPQEMNRTNPSTVNRGAVPNGTNPSSTERRFQGATQGETQQWQRQPQGNAQPHWQQGNVEPRYPQQGPTVLRGNTNQQGPQGAPQGGEHFNGRMSNQTVAPQSRTVAPQVQQHNPPAPQSRGGGQGAAQERRNPGGGER